MPFFMVRNDITKVKADAIVNPANEKLLEGSGTSRAIYLAAGERRLTRACKKIGYCKLGDAVVTKAFQLQAKYIIHAVGPYWIDGQHGEEEILYQTYRNSLELARQKQLESIAFPLLSAGNYGYPKDKALQVAIRAISEFLMEHEMTVYLVLYDPTVVKVGKKIFSRIEEYIDDHYVKEHDEILPKESNYRENARWEFQQRMGQKPFTAASRSPVRSLDELMKKQGETFSQMLLRLIDDRGLKDSYVYKKANVDRRHFSKIRNDIHYAPNKKTVFAFAVALELSLDETRDLLMRAGYAFSCCSKFDVILQFFIENHQYNIFEINEVLFAYEQPTLGE